MGVRYECRENGASKFWEVSKPAEVDSQWAVVVRFGKINGWEQTRVHPENTKWQADKYYDDKVAEKTRKGYTLAYVNSKSPKLDGIQAAAVSTPAVYRKKPPPCAHDNLSRKGNAWECKACKTVVENLYQGAIPEPEFEKKVRRFFDLSVRDKTT